MAILIGIIACCCKLNPFDDDHVDVDEDEPTLYYDPADPDIATKPPIEKKSEDKSVMNNDFFEKLKHRKNQEQEMKQVLRDIMVYAIYVTIIFIICYGNRDFNAFLQKEVLQTAVVHGGLNCGVGQEDDPRYRECDEDAVPNPHVDLMKVII